MARTGELVSTQSENLIDKQSLDPQQRPEWLTAKEAADHLRVKARTLLSWTRQGKINGYALSAAWLLAETVKASVREPANRVVTVAELAKRY